jgi:WD40 repeat protein
MDLWQAGDLIDSRYRVTRVLGRGGMGVVYQVRHLAWQTDLAVKRPRPEWFRAVAGRELFTAEAQTWVSLGLHPNVCCCHYVQVIEGVPVVFAEYVPGGSLSGWIGDGRLYEGDALARILDIAIQAARGLEHAHRRGVIHLDVKPANVLLAEGDTAKISDFGLARARAAVSEAAAGEAARSVAGDSAMVPGGGLMTRAYASPEQADDRPVGRRTDVYSLAVSVLEMIIGEVTWHSGTVAAAVLDARRADMPPELAGLLERCLAYDPVDRPSMASVAAEMARVYQPITGRRYARPVPEPASLRAAELNNRALSLLDLGQPDDAREAFRLALEADPRRREQLRVLRGGAASHLAISGDARFLLAAAELDGVVRLWELDSGRLLRTFRGVRDPVNAVHLDADYAGGDAGAAFTLTAREREPVRARPLGLPRGHVSKPVLSRPRPPAELAELGSRVETLTAGGREAMTAGRYREALGLLAQARQTRGYARDPGVVSLWRELGRHVTQVTVRTAWPARTWRGHASAVSSADLSADGRVAISGDEDGSVRVWDTGTGTCLHALTGHRDLVYSVALSADGQRILSASRGEVRLWRTATGECLLVLPAYGLLDMVPARFVPGEDRAVTGGGDGLIHVWDLADGSPVRVLRGHEGPVNDVRVSSGLVVSAGADTTVRVWDAGSGDCVRVLAGHQTEVMSVSLSADGTTAVSLAGRDIRVWDAASGRCLRRHTETEARITTIRFLAGARFVICAGTGRADSPHAVRVRDTVTGDPVLTIETTGAGATALAVSPCGPCSGRTRRRWTGCGTGSLPGRSRWCSPTRRYALLLDRAEGTGARTVEHAVERLLIHSYS